jgi:hypothetical protein
MLRITVSSCLCVCLAVACHGQKFHFGATTGLVLSQVDGDNLTGFNHIGYSVGVLGGYSIDEYHWMLLELQYATLGSKRSSEASGMPLPTDFKAIGVMLAYSVQFGDAWDDTREFRFLIGPRYNAIVDADVSLLTEDDLRNYLSFQATISYALSRNFLLDLSYSHALQNIMRKPLEDFDRLVPYYFSLGVSWYLHRG